MWNRRLDVFLRKSDRRNLLWIVGFIVLLGLITGCQSVPTQQTTASKKPIAVKKVPTSTATAQVATEPTSPRVEAPVSTPTHPPPATATKVSIAPTPKASPTFTPPPTATSVGTCNQRMPKDDLLAVVTLDYNISRDFEPDDLVLLTDWLPMSVTLGYPTKVRDVILEPLLSLIADMQEAGLSPQIISGYRSYPAQAIAWKKWNELYPDHASIISAPPGHSEHQLGTAVDFGSPELPEIVGEPDIEFHTLFYKTSEGQWLVENAYKYGFTLSFPLEAFELTGFYYEPWHYRYIGVEMATKLHEAGLSLTAHQLENYSQPCIP